MKSVNGKNALVRNVIRKAAQNLFVTTIFLLLAHSAMKSKTKTPAPKKATAKKPEPKKAAPPAKKPAVKESVAKKEPLKQPIKTPTKPLAAPAKKEAAKKEDDKTPLKTAVAPAAAAPPKKKMGGGGRPGRKPKNKDDEEEGIILEAPPEPHPVPHSKRKHKSPKDLAKERILAKLREKAEQQHAARQFLPTLKKKYTLEYIIKSSPVILFEFISTSAGLEQWFADKVDDHLDIFTFTWEGNDQKAEMVEMDDLEYVKYRWLDNPYDEYFEFRITSTEITGDTVLLITDFADANEMRDIELLWDSQVKTLRKRMGLGA